MKLPGVDDRIVLRAWTLWLANLSDFVVELKERGLTEEAEGLEKAGSASCNSSYAPSCLTGSQRRSCS